MVVMENEGFLKLNLCWSVNYKRRDVKVADLVSQESWTVSSVWPSLRKTGRYFLLMFDWLWGVSVCRSHIGRWWRWGRRTCGRGWWWSSGVKKASTTEEWPGEHIQWLLCFLFLFQPNHFIGHVSSHTLAGKSIKTPWNCSHFASEQPQVLYWPVFFCFFLLFSEIIWKMKCIVKSMWAQIVTDHSCFFF